MENPFGGFTDSLAQNSFCNRATIICHWISSTIIIRFCSKPIQPITKPAIINADKVELGNKLFHEKRLSPNNTVSCALCHDLSKVGTDQLPVSVEIHGQKGPINALTVYNSRHNIKQFWDGGANDLADQAGGPVTNPKEMGLN